MNKIKITFCWVIIGFLLAAKGTVAQERFAQAIANADTTLFSADKKSSWVLYNSWVGRYEKDSITLEFIVQRERNTIDWRKPQLIGHIKDAEMLPGKEVITEYFLLEDSYLVTISEKGLCYISLNKGFLPPTDPVIIPVQVKFAAKAAPATPGF